MFGAWQTWVYVVVAGLCFWGVLRLLGFLPLRGWFHQRRFPRALLIAEANDENVPKDAEEPLRFLREKLEGLGFRIASPPTAVTNFKHRLVLVPFYCPGESTFFLMGIETGLFPETHLMLHVLTPLKEGRRVETTTLGFLAQLANPSHIELHSAADAESVEEIYSRHRRALSQHERGERVEMEPSQWRNLITQAYQEWLQSGIRSQRLQLDSDGENYRIRSLPKSVV